MTFNSNKDLKLILHPYLFILKEGNKIQNNFLDYSLMMLQVTSPEVIRSPQNTSENSLLVNYEKLLQESYLSKRFN